MAPPVAGPRCMNEARSALRFAEYALWKGGRSRWQAEGQSWSVAAAKAVRGLGHEQYPGLPRECSAGAMT